ncbi:MAG: hypothetical protein ACE5F1_01465 [Planctomycetota bacterium]
MRANDYFTLGLIGSVFVMSGAILAGGCQGTGLGPAELFAAIEGPLQELVKRGGLSQEQATQVMGIVRGVMTPILGGGGFDWMRILEALATIAGSLLGVRIWRGGITSRRGTVPGASG